MQIGSQQYPIEESVLFLILILVLIFNVFLFNRGRGSYTIKYQIMLRHSFFRINQFATNFVNTLYKFFFILPFIIIVAITVLRGTQNYMQFPAILVNGLILIFIVYPVYRDYYYFQYGIIWFLALASQIFSQFLADSNLQSTSSFLEISFIFYTLNSLVFCLALIYNQKIYWELQDALSLVDQEQVKKVNSSWLDPTKQRKLPEIFYGGIYGSMSKNPSLTSFLGIYLFSVSILGVYAAAIYLIQNSYLGVCGLVTNIIYDIFILVFSSLKGTERSVRDLFFMVYLGRLLSFIFGQEYWLFGYCILYFLVGIFVGNVIIDKNFPLRIDSSKKETKRIKKNVLKTPQFILLLLTAEIVVLILVQELSSVTNISKLNFHDRDIPIWQFAILIVLAAWVIILYLLCGRLLARHIMKIRQMVEYYFGFSRISEYHAYMLLTYFLILAGGLYSLFYLYDKDVFLACAFLPVIYHFIFQIGTSWVKNDYCILADHESYDKKQFKKIQIRMIKLTNRLNKIQLAIQKKQLKNMQQERQGSDTADGYKQDNQDQGQQSLTQTAFEGTNYSMLKNSFTHRLPPLEKDQKKSRKDNKKITPGQLDEKKPNQASGSIQAKYRSAQYDEILKELKELKQQKENQKSLQNWRMDNTLTYLQIWQNLTPYDKTILTSLLITLLTLIIYSLVSYLWAQTVGGLGFSLSIISLLTGFFYYKINMSLRYSIGQIILTISGFLIGIVFWSFFYKIPFGAIIWSIVAIFIYGYCLKNNLQKNIQEIQFLVVILGIKIVLLLCYICIILGLNYGYVVLVISCGILVAILLGALNTYHLLTHGHIPMLLRVVTAVLLIAIVGSLSIIGFLLNIISNFAVFAITSGVIIASLFIVYLIISFIKTRKQLIHPHVYSAFGLTIYRFQSQIEQLKPSTNHIKIFNGAMILLVIFSSVTSLFYKQKYFAIYALSIFMICQFTELILRSIQTHYFFGQFKSYLTEKIANQAFKTVKDKYMASEIEGQDSPEFMKKLQQYLKKAQGATSDAQKDQLWLKVSSFKHEVTQNLEEEQRFLFFWMALMRFSLYTQRKNKMNDFLITLGEIKADLEQAGIFFQSLQSTEPVQIKYKMVKKQFNNLPPDDYLLVVDRLEEQMKLKKRRQKQIERMHIQQMQEHNKKMEEFFKKQSLNNSTNKKGEQELKKNDVEEFKKLIAGIKDNKLWDDLQFDLQSDNKQKYLGKLSLQVAGFRRPKAGQKFIVDTISADDVKQGKIGDCYLISSFAVLGQKHLKKAIGCDPDNPHKQWKNQKGAYMVKFHIFSKQVYIKVDDVLPVDQKKNRVFAVSQNSLEYWPGILQKAYAKLYGGYQNIVSGKCHQVLAEFSGGFPLQVKLDEYRKNNNALWNKLVSSFNNGFLMAAGSPSNPKGDSVASDLGIVQGHAYAILGVIEIENEYKLIKLKNPHGSGGKEWTGDFSDNSDYMTAKRKKLLDHKNKNDGIFWMQLEDFISQFFSLYICRIFDKNDWHYFPPFKGSWKKNANSYGRPEKTDKAHNNYQIGITVTKKSTLFISLRQQNKTALQGKNYICIRVQRNEGKRLRKNDVKSQNLCGLTPILSNPATLSSQILLESSSYPYTFTIYFCAEIRTDDKGGSQPGEGDFDVQMFCNDRDAKLLQDENFEPEVRTKN